MHSSEVMVAYWRLSDPSIQAMILPNTPRSPRDLVPAVTTLFTLSAGKIESIERTWSPDRGAPVFTVNGKYQARGWTEWTQGFQFGSALLQFDATDDRAFLERGRRKTMERMAPHLTHMGVHDHGFNNVSTYGALWRLAREGRIDAGAVGSRLLRAGAQGQRRRAGPAMDAVA